MPSVGEVLDCTEAAQRATSPNSRKEFERTRSNTMEVGESQAKDHLRRKRAMKY
jgi:hypothetical protein